jgi:hypothetical protein
VSVRVIRPKLELGTPLAEVKTVPLAGPKLARLKRLKNSLLNSTLRPSAMRKSLEREPLNVARPGENRIVVAAGLQIGPAGLRCCAGIQVTRMLESEDNHRGSPGMEIRDSTHFPSADDLAQKAPHPVARQIIGKVKPQIMPQVEAGERAIPAAIVRVHRRHIPTS